VTVSLRRITNADQGRLHRWRNLPAVARWMYHDHVISEDEHNAWFASMTNDETRIYWVALRHDRPVGVVHLSNIASGAADWGVYIAEDSAMGTGAGSGAAFLSLDYAFANLGLHKVRCEAIADNARAITMYERVGFRREGLLRSNVRRGSDWLDVVALGLLSQEWNVLRAGIKKSLLAHNVLEEPAHG